MTYSIPGRSQNLNRYWQLPRRDLLRDLPGGDTRRGGSAPSTTPGSIQARLRPRHAFGAASDNPDLIAVAVGGRTTTERFHVRGFIDDGTTTTPFDMVVRNKMSRFHLCMQALRRSGYAEAGPRLDLVGGVR